MPFKRKCIYCGSEFKPVGHYARLCPTCRKMSQITHKRMIVRKGVLTEEFEKTKMV
jgi:hypothetical protein